MSLEELLDQAERDERALEKIASALDALAKIAEKFYQRLYPEKQGVREAVLSTVRTDEEAELRETIQGTESTLDQWRELGPREREFVEKEKAGKIKDKKS